MRFRWQALGLVVVAVLAAPAAAGVSGKKRVWVGTVTLTYVRSYELPRSDGRVTTEFEDRKVTITNHPNGTATASAVVHVYRENYCSGSKTYSHHVEDWTWHGRVATIGVDWVRTRYHVSFVAPGVMKVQVTDESCGRAEVHRADVATMPVGFQLYGTAPPDARAVAGTWGHYPECADACLSHYWEARWTLVLRERKGTPGAKAGGGTVTLTAPSGYAGARCEASILDGTAGDDHLTGTAAAELLRGFDGNDTIDGADGGDCLQGGNGDDALAGGPGNDLLVGGAGTDRFDAGPGDDDVEARDGVAETVDCGAGTDRALVDAADRTVGCELARK